MHRSARSNLTNLTGRARAAVLLAAVGLTIGAAAGCGGAEAEVRPSGGGSTPVKVLTVSPSASQGSMALTGTVEAEETVEIRPESTGPVASIGFDHGQQVHEGDVLLRLRDTDARAAVSEAEARLALAQTSLDRNQALFDRQNASRQDVDRSVAERDLATAQLAHAREQQRRTVVRAPFDGVTGLREVAPGEVVDPSRVVTRLESVARVVVDVDVPERWLTRVAVGQPASITVDARPGDRFDGEVVFVAPRITAETRTARSRIRVPNEDGRLVPGMTARVSVAGEAEADAILVPSQAIVTSASGPSVWVVSPEGTVEARRIETADRGADLVRVVSGLAAGDQVVVEGLIRLRPGAHVEVTSQIEPPSAQAGATP